MLLACQPKINDSKIIEQEEALLKVGAERLASYLPKLTDKKVAIVGNHSSQISGVHLLDTLLSRGVDVVKVFSPEHGFRGIEDAGEEVKDGIDPKSGLPLISLYGDNKKPTAMQLEGIDIILFDLQDVGVRFYTYLSTLHYVMEAAAEKNIKVVVLDRPNPNLKIVDGPIMQADQMSFVGLHPVPLIYGMSIGEYALMINGEKWLKNGIYCELEVIHCENLNRDTHYKFPIPPSPNLPNMKAIALYPSLALFEGTVISVGRGTDNPFQQIGHPDLSAKYSYSFMPSPTEGASNPKLNGKKCFGIPLFELDDYSFKKLELKYLIELYANFPQKKDFFNSYFPLLAGDKKLEAMIREGKTEDEIREFWEADLREFKKLRENYLLYSTQP